MACLGREDGMVGLGYWAWEDEIVLDVDDGVPQQLAESSTAAGPGPTLLGAVGRPPCPRGRPRRTQHSVPLARVAEVWYHEDQLRQALTRRTPSASCLMSRCREPCCNGLRGPCVWVLRTLRPDVRELWDLGFENMASIVRRTSCLGFWNLVSLSMVGSGLVGGIDASWLVSSLWDGCLAARVKETCLAASVWCRLGSCLV